MQNYSRELLSDIVIMLIFFHKYNFHNIDSKNIHKPRIQLHNNRWRLHWCQHATVSVACIASVACTACSLPRSCCASSSVHYWALRRPDIAMQWPRVRNSSNSNSSRRTSWSRPHRRRHRRRRISSSSPAWRRTVRTVSDFLRCSCTNLQRRN